MEQILPRQDGRTPNELRWIYGLGGAALLIWGSRSRSWVGLALSAVGADLLGWSFTGHYLHEALGVTQLTSKGSRAVVPYQLGIRLERSIAVYRPTDEVYRFFRDFKNLSRFLKHVKDVREIDDKHSHWFVRGPAGMELEWHAEIINDEPNELISWRTAGCADVESTGSVRFERTPGERGTLLHVSLNYLPPAGALGAAVAKLFGEEPEAQIKEDLRRLKQILEAGEVASVEGQPTGPRHPTLTDGRHEGVRGEAEELLRAPQKARAAASGTTD